MVDEFLRVTEVVGGVELTAVDSLADPVSASGDVELPLAILHVLVVAVEGTEEYLGLGFFDLIHANSI
jgi:hypothetical protein